MRSPSKKEAQQASVSSKLSAQVEALNRVSHPTNGKLRHTSVLVSFVKIVKLGLPIQVVNRRLDRLSADSTPLHFCVFEEAQSTTASHMPHSFL
jgi:hypothetical protein